MSRNSGNTCKVQVFWEGQKSKSKPWGTIRLFLPFQNIWTLLADKIDFIFKLFCETKLFLKVTKLKFRFPEKATKFEKTTFNGCIFFHEILFCQFWNDHKCPIIIIINYYITLLVSSNCTFKESTSIGSSHLASKSDFSCKIWAFSALAESNSSWRLSSCFSTCSNLSGSAESLAYKQKYFINMKILKT